MVAGANSSRIQERSIEANERREIGHWEADTAAGKTGFACLPTLTDRLSRYLLAAKAANKTSKLVADKMIELLSPLPKGKRRSVTSDRGKEFAEHDYATQALNGLPFYFSDPQAPWQRGTNENTNGLIRDSMPKSCDIALMSDNDISDFVRKLALRPRKCLGWKTPYEVFFSLSLHLT